MELRALRNICMKVGPLIQQGAVFSYMDAEEVDFIVKAGYAEVVTNPVEDEHKSLLIPASDHTLTITPTQLTAPLPYSVPLVVGRRKGK